MTASDEELVEAVKEDFGGVEIHDRISTMLLTTGLIAFGFLLGVGYYGAIVDAALPVLFATEYPSAHAMLTERYQHGVIAGVFLATTGLVGAFYIEFTTAEDDSE